MLAEAMQNRCVSMSSHEDYQDCFDTTTTGIIYLDHTLRIQNLNRAAERICGVMRSLAIGERVDQVFQHYGADFVNVFYMNEQDEFQTRNIHVRLHDQMVYLHADVLRIINTNAGRGGFIVILQDVSAVRAAVKQIQTTKLLMSLGELAAGVAHHVRTPLTTISGYLQVMLGRVEQNRYTVRRDMLETMLDEVSYINNVVKELILFAKPPIQKKPGVNVNRLLESSLRLTFKEMGGEHIALAKELAEALPLIFGDEHLLQQALVHVLQNAMEAMPEQGTLQVRTWLNSEQQMVVIAVQDNGEGIASDIFPRIFEPFYTSKLDRMGLGLPVAHRIIAEHGGFINIAANEGQGTKVHIYLPILNERMHRLSLVHQQILNLQ